MLGVDGVICCAAAVAGFLSPIFLEGPNVTEVGDSSVLPITEESAGSIKLREVEFVNLRLELGVEG